MTLCAGRRQVLQLFEGRMPLLQGRVFGQLCVGVPGIGDQLEHQALAFDLPDQLGAIFFFQFADLQAFENRAIRISVGAQSARPARSPN